jgi:hypothetical protein
MIGMRNRMRNRMQQEKRSAAQKQSGRARKRRKTFTLSQESIALLNDLRAPNHGSQRRSLSGVLDDLLRALDRQRKREAVENAVTKFYDGLSAEAQQGEREWGEFSLTQFTDGSV